MVFALIPSIIKIFWYFLWLYPCILGQGSEIWPKIWLLLRLGLPTRQNPRWPPIYRKIAKIVMKYLLIDLEWWFWCSNVGLLTQGIISRQQKTCMSNIWWPHPRWSPFYQKKSKNSHEIWTDLPRVMVLVLRCRFIKSRINIKTTWILYVKYLVAKSKMATILLENYKKKPWNMNYLN